MTGKLIALFAAAAVALGGCGGQDEGISVDEAREKGLLRDDAVSVTGPDDARAGTITLELAVPAAANSDRVEVLVSGDCRATLDGPAVRAPSPIRVTASPPDGADECVLVVDALVPDRPETGDGHSVTVRR